MNYCLAYNDNFEREVAGELNNIETTKFFGCVKDIINLRLSKNNLYILIMLIDNFEKESLLNSIMLELRDFNIGYIVSSNEKSFVKTIKKYNIQLTEGENCRNLYLNLLDPTVKEGITDSLTIKNRKSNIDELIESNSSNFNSISMIAHGNGDILYLGKKRIVPNNLECSEKDISINDVLVNNSTKYLFLNSCFSLKFNKENSIFESLNKSDLEFFILYRGLKDNYFADCLWFHILSRLGYNAGNQARVINLNVANRTTDRPSYMLIGNPSKTIYKEEKNVKSYQVDDNFILDTTDDNQHSYYGVCKLSNETFQQIKGYMLYNKSRIHWLYDDRENKLFLFSEGAYLPNRIIFKKIEKSHLDNNIFEKVLLLKKGFSKEVRSKVVEWEQQFIGLQSLKSSAKLYSDLAYKYIERKKLNDGLYKKICSMLLKELADSSSAALSPLSESYIHKFESHTSKVISRRCPHCENILEEKKVIAAHNPRIMRKITSCINCGQVTDEGVGLSEDESAYTKFKFRKNILNFAIEKRKFNLSEVEKPLFYLIVSGNEYGEVTPILEFKEKQDKVEFEVVFETTRDMTQHVIKILMMVEGDLKIFTKAIV